VHKQGAQSFKATRQHHSTEAAEDYSELIAELIASEGSARTCTIAKRLGISHVTALRTMQRLQEEGYLETAPHKPVTLTKKGQRVAAFAKKRHRLLVDFFQAIGVPKKQAEIDVEGAEHHISKKTLQCVEAFLSDR